MSETFVRKDRQTLGWLAVGLLLFALGSPAWALDLERQAAMERDSAQILATLGRDKGINQNTSASTRKTVQVRLIHKTRAKRPVVR
jgi:hypothetical protein